MKKTIVMLSALLLTCFVHTAAMELPDFKVGHNSYFILRAEDGSLTDEVRLHGHYDNDMIPPHTYCGGEKVTDEVKYEGKTYKVVEFGPFWDCYYKSRVHRLIFGKNMRKVDLPAGYADSGFYLTDGFEVSEENKYLKAIDGILYTADGKTLLKCHPSLNSSNYGSSPKSIVIPDDVETIGPYAFSNCSYITIDHLPKSLKKIKAEAFYDSDILPEELVIPEGVREIDRNAFCSTKIRTLTLPSTLERFGFIGSMKCFETIVCLAPTPPALIDENGYTWSLWWADVFPDVVLMVPPESVELYRQHPDWGALFKNIRAYDPTGIASLTNDNATDGKTYRLDGTPALSTQSGIYIRDGRKVVVK